MTSNDCKMDYLIYQDDDGNHIKTAPFSRLFDLDKCGSSGYIYMDTAGNAHYTGSFDHKYHSEDDPSGNRIGVATLKATGTGTPSLGATGWVCSNLINIKDAGPEPPGSPPATTCESHLVSNLDSKAASKCLMYYQGTGKIPDPTARKCKPRDQPFAPAGGWYSYCTAGDYCSPPTPPPAPPAPPAPTPPCASIGDVCNPLPPSPCIKKDWECKFIWPAPSPPETPTPPPTDKCCKLDGLACQAAGIGNTTCQKTPTPPPAPSPPTPLPCCLGEGGDARECKSIGVPPIFTCIA